MRRYVLPGLVVLVLLVASTITSASPAEAAGISRTLAGNAQAANLPVVNAAFECVANATGLGLVALKLTECSIDGYNYVGTPKEGTVAGAEGEVNWTSYAFWGPGIDVCWTAIATYKLTDVDKLPLPYETITGHGCSKVAP